MGGNWEWIRDDEVELLRVGEVSDAGVRHVGGLVRRHYIIPATHCAPLLLPAPKIGSLGRSAGELRLQFPPHSVWTEAMRE